MTEKTIATGVVHKVPEDLREALISNPNVLAKWNSLTPIQRATSGFAGLPSSKSRKREPSISSAWLQS